MLFRPMTNKKKVYIYIIATVGLAMLTVWLLRFCTVNKRAIRQEIQYFEAGCPVPLEGNFMFIDREDTDGYSITVNNMRLVDCRELYLEHGEKMPEYEAFPAHTYCVLLDITVENLGNEDGYIETGLMNLYNKSLALPIDYEIWKMIDENFKGSSLKLRPNTTVSLTIPYTAQNLDEAMNQKEINRRLENEEFNLCVSEYPAVKLVKVKVEDR